MYNTFHTTGSGINTQTDGWTTTLGTLQNPLDVANGTNIVPWLGTSGNARPFGYTGQAALHWAVQLNGAADSAIISAADSTKYSADPFYNGPAEIDTAGGAWEDNSVTPTGWKHATDIGLISSDVDQNVTLYIRGGGVGASIFGVTIFEGMDTTTYDSLIPATKYSHHGRWNCPTCTGANLTPYTNSNPWYRDATTGLPIGTGMTNLQYSNTVDAINGITFLAEAGKVYSIALGGWHASGWSAAVDHYVLGVNTAPVPVPAAVWLLGSALAGMGVIGRRRQETLSA
jgi:hypothetical protein